MLSYDNQFVGTTWGDISSLKQLIGVGCTCARENFALLVRIFPSFRNTETWKVSKSEGNKAMITMMLLQLRKGRHAGQELITLQTARGLGTAIRQTWCGQV